MQIAYCQNNIFHMHFFQCSCVCSDIERNLPCKEFHTLAPIKVVNFNPKFVVLLRWTTSLLLPLKHFTFLIKYDETSHLCIPVTYHLQLKK